MDKPAPVDPINTHIGDLGIWQLYLCLIVFLSKFPTGTVTLSSIFFTAPVKTTCIEPENITDICSDECEKYEFDKSDFTNTPVTEWDLVCNKKHWQATSQGVVMFGIMIGSLVFGVFSDRCGRKPAFITCCMINLVFGLLVSVSPNFWVFLIFRWFDAFATGGIMVTSFVIVMEIVGKSRREIMSILYQIPFNIGHSSLALFAYVFREWRWYNFGFSVCSVVYVIYFCLLPESPRWLLTRGKIDQAVAVLEKGARCNKLPTEQIRPQLEEAYKKISGVEIKRGTMIDLFRFPNLRKKTIVMAFNWLVVCLVYYGVAQYVTNLGGSIFINVVFGALLGVPGTIICVPMTIYLGRRWTLIISNTVSGFALLGLAIVQMMEAGTLPQVILATIGLFGASVTFPNVYLYGGELFPTVVRNSGVGFCSLTGRGGSIVAPYISYLSNLGIWIPPMIFGVVSVLAAISVFFLLPETRGVPLPETIEDAENMGK